MRASFRRRGQICRLLAGRITAEAVSRLIVVQRSERLPLLLARLTRCRLGRRLAAACSAALARCGRLSIDRLGCWYLLETAVGSRLVDNRTGTLAADSLAVDSPGEAAVKTGYSGKHYSGNEADSETSAAGVAAGGC